MPGMDDARGFRDVYWCWIVNEPFIIEFTNDKPKCTCCNWVDDTATDGKVSDTFLAEHTFMQHLTKPERKS